MRFICAGKQCKYKMVNDVSENSFYQIAKLSPCISTENLGDYIIQDCCDQIFEEIFGHYLSIGIPTRERLSRGTRRKVAASDYAFVCGTNLLASNMEHWKQWNIGLPDALAIRFGDVRKRELLRGTVLKQKYRDTHVILMGAGWFEYQGSPSRYTEKLLKILLDENYLHSVRDRYTQEKLRSMGITNVVNTACPTMWKLTEDFCRTIPVKKAGAVVATLTDYRVDPEADKALLSCLLAHYDKVYVWLQSVQDYAYLQELAMADRVEIIPPTLKDYDAVLAQPDLEYVGTRLHGGIRALNRGKRACILGVDNRALEIGRDTNLPVLDRNRVSAELETWIEEERKTQIRLPVENIRRWKEQFASPANRPVRKE